MEGGGRREEDGGLSPQVHGALSDQGDGEEPAKGSNGEAAGHACAGQLQAPSPCI